MPLPLGQQRAKEDIMVACKKCGAEFQAELDYHPQSGGQFFNCPKCGAKHITRDIPSAPGGPGQAEYRLAESGE